MKKTMSTKKLLRAIKQAKKSPKVKYNGMRIDIDYAEDGVRDMRREARRIGAHDSEIYFPEDAA